MTAITFTFRPVTANYAQWLRVASSPGHSQILSRSFPNFSPRLRDKIWEWPGNEARLRVLQVITILEQRLYEAAHDSEPVPA